jgi:hypothetical protein
VMKALTVWQPWATLIAISAKPYEFRGWKPPQSLVGQRIAIHAGARPVRRAEVHALVRALKGHDGFTNPCLHCEIALPILERVLAAFDKSPDTLFGTESAVTLPLSHVVCTATVGEPKMGNVCASEFGDNSGNDSDRDGTFNWGWPMLDVKSVVPPIPAKGMQGLWNYSNSEIS